MPEKQKEQPVCKNVFKDGADNVSTKLFTQIWIDLINFAERSNKPRDSK